MERLEELIGKLKEQFEQRADPSKLLGITLLIERELMKQEQPKPAAVASSKVSVTMPAARNGYAAVAEKPAVKEITEVEPDEYIERVEPAKRQAAAQFQYDPMVEIPTLTQQQSAKEINELIGIREASLNDKLKEDKIEVGHVLTDHPIRDLKKAIGINDRYVFINELFRGDDVMYERSLKTINSFRIFAEAEYWIERELKVKLGWEEHKDTTRHFYQLIKRRFS